MRDIGRFFKFWAATLATGGKIAVFFGGLASLIVGGSVFAYLHETHTKHRVLWIVGGTVAFVVVVMVAAFRRWDEATKELEQLKRGKIPDEHRDQLQGQLRGLFNKVWSGELVNYGDAVDGADINAQVFSAHLPDLARELQDWNKAVEQKAKSLANLKDAVAIEGAKRGLPTPAYTDWQTVVDRLSDLSADWALKGTLGQPFDLHWDYANYEGVSGPGPGEGQEVQIWFLGDNHHPIAHIAARPHATGAGRYKAICHEVDELFRAVQDCDEAKEIKAADDALEKKKLALRDEIFSWQDVTVFRSEPDCPTCRRNLGLTAQRASARDSQARQKLRTE